MHKTTAFQIADSINIKDLKKGYVGKLLYSDSDELFYENDIDKYVYVFEYGVVGFFGFDQIEMTQFINLLYNYTDSALENKISEDFLIEVNQEKIEVGYDKIYINKLDTDIIRIIMLNVAQSVSLDYFNHQAEQLLNETKVYTRQLETNGKVNIKGKELMKFIGKSLNLKNKISQNLYVFDSHPFAWENEFHDKVDTNLKKAFDLFNRVNNFKEDIAIIKDNLDLFKDLMQHRTSSVLEWIIIWLIMVEVANMFLEKFL